MTSPSAFTGRRVRESSRPFPVHNDSSLTPKLVWPVAAALDGTAGSAVLDMEAAATPSQQGAITRAAASNLSSTKGQTMLGDLLVLVPVRDLQVGDDVVDEHGPRRVTKIERYKSSAFISFSEGKSNWYFDSEVFPVEHLS